MHKIALIVFIAGTSTISHSQRRPNSSSNPARTQALHEAIKNSASSKVRELLEHQDLNTPHPTTQLNALAQATICGNYEIMRIVLGLDSSVCLDSPAMLGTQYAKPNTYVTSMVETSPLVLAARHPVRCIALLINQGASVKPAQSPRKKTIKNTQGERALLSASLHANNDVVALLLSHHVDPNCVDRDGYTPLMRLLDQRTSSKNSAAIIATLNTLLAKDAHTASLINKKKVFKVVENDTISAMIEAAKKKE